MDIFFEVHQDLPREAPGSNECTRKAYSMLPSMPAEPLILDVGCGPGGQTVELARLSHGRVIGIDTHQPFLDVLRGKAEAAGVGDVVSALNCSMFAMPFAEETFDLIWAEGSIYIIGFEKGLKEWRRLLEPSGCMAVTELSWLKPNPPPEPVDFWNRDYPGIKSIAECVNIMTACGFTEIGHFVLPENAWWESYYHPMERRIEMLRRTYADDRAALDALDREEAEIVLYRDHSEWYGYVFYVMQRRDSG